MKVIEILAIIDDINAELYDTNSDIVTKEGFSYHFETNGYVDQIFFNSICLYNSEIDTEEDVIQSGGLKLFLKKRLVGIIKKIQSCFDYEYGENYEAFEYEKNFDDDRLPCGCCACCGCSCNDILEEYEEDDV